MPTTARRPDLSAYFRSRIDFHVRGMFARNLAPAPADVRRIDGDVTADIITVTMRDGTVWRWSGGRYAARKVAGCYAPLMPRPIAAEVTA